MKFKFCSDWKGLLEKWLSRWAHNPKIVGSIPTEATNFSSAIKGCLGIKK